MAKKKKNRPTPDGAPSDPPFPSTPAPENEEAPAGAPLWKSVVDIIAVLGGAIAIACLIKAYIFDVYLIPSGSMETALHGRPDGGDRILCSKLHYHFRPLKRWEVAVFEFPYEAAKAYEDPKKNTVGTSEQYKGQNFVKRVVGLPGETLAIARGDVWVKRDGENAYKRLVKPHSVQQGMWLNVYAEDFAAIAEGDFKEFWNITGNGEITVDKGKSLRLAPGDNALLLDYRPRLRAGANGDLMAELTGIPDRYTLRQPIQFVCQTIRDNGEVCGKKFAQTFQTHNIAAHCPACGEYQLETSVVFYHRRSGLDLIGRYAVGLKSAPQGETTGYRQSDYFIVPDLRVALDLTFQSDQSWTGITLSENNRYAEARFYADGRVEILINGKPPLPEHRAVGVSGRGIPQRIEFYIVDGAARVFAGSDKEPLLDVPLWNDRLPSPRATVRNSGVRLIAGGGETVLDSIAIDRDVYYYSGWERSGGEEFPAIGAQAQIHIDKNSFFPMGDHCTSSYDARSWGGVSLNNLKGPALLVWWPPDRFGPIAAP